MIQYDFIVLGSGGGLNIARAAAARGLSVALIEKSAAGGTCLNRGCIPSKMLLYPAEKADAMRRSGRLNLRGGESAGIDFTGLVSRISATVDDVSAGIVRELAAHENITLYPDCAAFAAEREIAVGQKLLSADTIVIATGSHPAIPDIPGLAGTPYMTSREALRRRELPRRLIVIGAGYIATELGYAYQAAGAEVSFVVRSRFLRALDREIAAEFERVFAAGHAIHQGCVPVEVRYDAGLFAVACRYGNGDIKTIEAEALLVATGVVPATDSLGLENTRITRDERGYIQVDDCLQTSSRGIYALGDVIGRYFFRHTANYEARHLIQTVVAGTAPAPLEYGPVPYAVFTVPQIAGVGLTEEEVRARGRDYVVGRATYADSAPGMARLSEHGLVKIIVDRRSRQVLGAHCVGDEASTMIHLFIVLMQKQGTLDDLLNLIFIHPALPEVARDAARDAERAW
jgi:mycothione reductase